MALTLSMARAKTAVWYITVVQYDGTTPQDLTGSVLSFHASVDDVEINKNSPSNGITITNPTGGLATLQIDASDTTGVAVDGTFVGPCELNLTAGGNSYELNAGTLTIAPHVDTCNATITVSSGGSGSVTSVAMTGDDVIFDAAVTGSPITSSGTLIPALKTQLANVVLAGPTTGSAAAPTFRALVAADISGIATPGAPANSVQFNSSGSFGGSANLTWNNTTDVLAIAPTHTVTSGVNNAVAETYTVNPSADASGAAYQSFRADLNVPGGNARDIAQLLGIASEISPSGSGAISRIYNGRFALNFGGSHNLNYVTSLFGYVDHFSSGTITEGYSVYGEYEVDGPGNSTTGAVYGGVLDCYGGTITNGFGVWIKSPDVSGGSVTNYFAFYSGDAANAGIAQNYYEWFDSRGVRRVKEDSTFDSVGQAIEALYNPQFAKYTPGAVDFERIILGQWNGNVAEIGVEKGGTGTFRSLRLLGAGVIIPAVTVATLPASPVLGMRSTVSDSNAASFTAGIGTIVATGGSTKVPVFYDGTNWRIG